MERDTEGQQGGGGPAPLTDFRFGAVAVWGGLVSCGDIDRVLAEQEEKRSRGEGAPRVGEMLVAEGLVTEVQVQRVLRVQLQRLPAEGHLLFGRIAAARGFATEEAVSRALDEQSREILAGGAPSAEGKVRRLGELLVDAGEIGPDDVEAIIAYQASADTVPMSEARKRSASAQVSAGPGIAAQPDTPETPEAPETPSSSDAGVPEGGERPAFLPRGAWGFVLDNSIWIAAGLAVALAVVLAVFRDVIFG